MPKSASTFAFLLARDIAQSHSDQVKLRQLLPEDLRDPFQDQLGAKIERISDAIPDEKLYVVKTHCLLNEAIKGLLVEGKAKAMVSYRDPYDVVVSIKDAGEAERQKPMHKQRQWFAQIKSYEDAVEWMPQILKIAESWLEYTDVLRIPFSKIAREPLNLTNEIANYMCVTTANVSKIVKPYISNKKSIEEFNVGVEGRGYGKFSLSENKDINKKMDYFLKLYF